MTLFLASVTGAEEAEIAVAHGADIIDLKDPTKGALGALPAEEVRTAVAAVSGRRPFSAVIGDLPMQPDSVFAAASAMAQTGVDYIKVGLFPESGREACVRALHPLARKTKLIGVMFVDLAPDLALVRTMADCGFAGAMLDTARKDTRRLLDHMDMPGLREFVAACRSHGIIAGLAGSLETPDVPRLLLLQPDVLGFRTALCARRDRAAPIDDARVDVVRELIPLDERSALYERQHAPVDYRLLAARGYSFDPTKDAPTDHVFVHDLVLPVRIGAYASEHEKPQRVRFNVDVQVLRPPHEAEDMRDVFSYDVITDGISMIVALGHVTLAETLAERIAALLLEHPRVVRATVRLEKLDLGPGAVGVTIERERAAEVAEVHQLYPAVKRDPNAAE
jgi:(5-formylfuran-3-yl)methyl phosphate synthase